MTKEISKLLKSTLESMSKYLKIKKEISIWNKNKLLTINREK